MRATAVVVLHAGTLHSRYHVSFYSTIGEDVQALMSIAPKVWMLSGRPSYHDGASDVQVSCVENGHGLYLSVHRIYEQLVEYTTASINPPCETTEAST
jgi:hypothetical protein